MPDIDGTTGDDDIDVTNDSGTINGGAAVNPVDSINAGTGDDEINIVDSTIAGSVSGGSGNDIINVTNSSINRLTSAFGEDTINISGSTVGTIRLGRDDDVLNFVGTTVTNAIDGRAGTDAFNLPAGTVVVDALGTFTVAAGVSYTLTDGSFTLPSGITGSYINFETGTGIPCFVHGTQVQTPSGPRPVEDLKAGDFVVTRHNGPQKVRWIGHRQFDASDLDANPKLRPIRILAQTLGGGRPKRDLLVSRQHRMLVQSKIAERMFGQSDALISAVKLTDLPGIFIDETVKDVTYCHLLFEQHEIIFAEGAPTESLFTGPQAMKALSALAREEIMTIFPQIADLNYAPRPACPIPSAKCQKRLVARHRKNSKPLLFDRSDTQGPAHGK